MKNIREYKTGGWGGGVKRTVGIPARLSPTVFHCSLDAKADFGLFTYI